jgi:hypothetical protein
MLTDLCDDVQGIILQKLDIPSLVMLCNVNKYYRDSVSDYTKSKKLKIKLSCSIIAVYGYLEVLKWARENKYTWNLWTCTNAAEGGHLEVLKWARENECEWNRETCFWAANNGHVEVLKWARDNDCHWDSHACFLAAANNGHLEIFKWARENGCEWDSCAEQLVKRKWPKIFS